MLQLDAPSRIYEVPENRDVAAFIGSMNFFDGVIEAAEGEIDHVRCGGKSLLKASLTHAGGSAVTVAVRPEKVSLGETGTDNRIAGTLSGTAHYGDGSHMHMQAADGSTVLISAPNARRAADQHRKGRSSPASARKTPSCCR